ncbi:2065_t:CDS:2, partial [Funneliformis caledonium]
GKSTLLETSAALRLSLGTGNYHTNNSSNYQFDHHHMCLVGSVNDVFLISIIVYKYENHDKSKSDKPITLGRINYPLQQSGQNSSRLQENFQGQAGQKLFFIKLEDFSLDEGAEKATLLKAEMTIISTKM